jgi:hypothetical protein
MRINGTTKAPVVHHFGEAIAGAMTIRAFKKENMFVTPETLPISLVHLVWTMDHSLLNSISPSGTVSASACGTDLESYEFLMELANITFLIQLLAIGY